MAWLEADARPIVAGWGPEPKLEAPSIGSLVTGILANRLGQQKLTQDTLSEAIKAYQGRQQASAFGTALQNEGLVSPGTDVSGMGSADLARLVQARLEQTPDKEMDLYHTAAAAKEQAIADAIKSGTYPYRGSGGSNAYRIPAVDGEGNPIVDADGNPIMLDPRSKIGQQMLANQNPSLSAPTTPGGVNTAVKTYPGVTPNDIVDPTRQSGFKISPDGSKLVPIEPGDTYEDDVTHVQIQPSTPGSPPVTVSKKEFERMKRAVIGPSYDPRTPNAEPPADVPDLVTPGTPGSQRVRPDASNNAPVNLPQVGDQRPGPNGSTVEWDGHGWKIVQ